MVDSVMVGVVTYTTYQMRFGFWTYQVDLVDTQWCCCYCLLFDLCCVLVCYILL